MRMAIHTLLSKRIARRVYYEKCSISTVGWARLVDGGLPPRVALTAHATQYYNTCVMRGDHFRSSDVNANESGEPTADNYPPQAPRP